MRGVNASSTVEERAGLYCAMAIYLHGNDLDPDEVTHRLGISPTDSWRRGDGHRFSSGTEVSRKGGLWTLRLNPDGPGAGVAMTELKSALAGYSGSLLDIPGVEDAYLDVFAIAGVESEAIEISREIVDILSGLGLRLQITIGR